MSAGNNILWFSFNVSTLRPISSQENHYFFQRLWQQDQGAANVSNGWTNQCFIQIFWSSTIRGSLSLCHTEGIEKFWKMLSTCISHTNKKILYKFDSLWIWKEIDTIININFTLVNKCYWCCIYHSSISWSIMFFKKISSCIHNMIWIKFACLLNSCIPTLSKAS